MRAEPPGLPAGVNALEHLKGVLASVELSVPNRQLLVLTHRTPDPDALGALKGMEFLLRNAFSLDPIVATVGRISRAENLAMVREIGIEYRDYDSLDLERISAAILVDSQPTFGHTLLPEGIPVLAVLDHHEPPPPDKRARYDVPHYDVRLGVGSTSSIVYEYLRDAGLTMDATTATALCCGVRFDTAELSIHVTPLDNEAFLETFRLADRGMLARIKRPPLPAAYYRDLHHSLARARRHGPLVFGFLGRVRNPESVAEMADFFLRMEGCRWSLVGGAHQGTYHLSLRTVPTRGDAYPLMEAIVGGEGSFGGRGTVAGGQIPLEGPDDQSLLALERRLRSRALKLVDPALLTDTDPRYGTRLLRLS